MTAAIGDPARSPGLVVAVDFHGVLANIAKFAGPAQFRFLERSWGRPKSVVLNNSDLPKEARRPQNSDPIEQHRLFPAQIRAVNSLPGEKVLMATGGGASLTLIQKAQIGIEWDVHQPARGRRLDANSRLLAIKIDPKFYVDGEPPFDERQFLELLAEGPDLLAKVEFLAETLQETGKDLLAIDDAFNDLSDPTFLPRLEMFLGSIKSPETSQLCRVKLIGPIFSQGYLNSPDHEAAREFCKDLGLNARPAPGPYMSIG